MTNAQGHAHVTPTSSPRSARRVMECLALTAAAAAMVSVAGSPAMAAPLSADGSTIANVEVQAAIALTGLTTDFTLSGAPGATVTTGANAVAMNVETNNRTGYSVTVQPAADELVPDDQLANGDTIPVTALAVREAGANAFTAFTDALTPITVHSQANRSAQGGDTITNDYQVLIPFVNTDTYSVTLDYVATAL